MKAAAFSAKPAVPRASVKNSSTRRIQLYSDPMNAEVPGSPWAPDGRPRRKVDWIKDGVVANVGYSRFWAKKKGNSD